MFEHDAPWFLIILGNLFSAGVCFWIPLPAHLLYSQSTRLLLAPYSTPLTWFAGVGSAAVFALAFIIPARHRQVSAMASCTTANSGEQDMGAELSAQTNDGQLP